MVIYVKTMIDGGRADTDPPPIQGATTGIYLIVML